MRDVIDINEVTKESYALLTHKLPEFIAMGIAEQFDKLLFAVPPDIGRVSDVKSMMESILYLYGDMGSPMDYESIGVLADTKERLKEHLDKHATDPEEAMARIMSDLVNALKGIGDTIISKLMEFDIPVVSDVGAIYRFHSIKNSQLVFAILDYEQLMTAGGR